MKRPAALRYGLIKVVTVVACALVWSGVAAAEFSPQVLVTADDRDAILDKLDNAPWAKSAFTKLQDRVDRYVAKVQEDPAWATSRMAMNWDTHYTQTVVKGSRSVDGTGRAPVPTPRFTGARDWKTDYVRQPLDELIPYNDQDGLIKLINIKTNEAEWVHPSITGHSIRRINEDFMGLASEAAFVYWVTGDKKYAELAAPILWSYMEGFSHVKPPHIADGHAGTKRIIGSATYEVIHDGILEQVALTYDFMRDYIDASEEIDADVIEQGIKVFIDRIIAGGGAQGNWNIHQASKISYGGLALQSNEAYADGKGREYYVDVVLNAQLPHQKGLVHVIKDNIDQETGLWPEAAGYGFDAIANVIELASLVSADPAGQKVMADPVLMRGLLAMRKVTYPSGISTGVGDTSYARINARAYEMMIPWALSQGDEKNAQTIAAALQQEMDMGAYTRDELYDTLVGLTRYVAELPEANADALALTPTYNAKPLNILLQRNVSPNGDDRYALAAALFGTRGGHMHTNGMAIELYAGGEVLGVDPGRGSSYWQPDHGEYYRALPAHNTVLINGGEASYPSHSKAQERMLKVKPELVEPAFGQDASDPNFSYITGSFRYPKPAATQSRTVALIRVDETTGFYFDVFRSRLDKPDSQEFHDWMYHAMADQTIVQNAAGQPVATQSSGLLTHANGNAKGYDYFMNETSVVTNETLRVSYPVEINDKSLAMDVWLLGGTERQVFCVDSPANRAARHYVEESVWNRLRPALIVRNQGEAWDRPFVTVYEPYFQADGSQIQSVESTGDNAWRVTGNGWSVDLQLDGAKLSYTLNR